MLMRLCNLSETPLFNRCFGLAALRLPVRLMLGACIGLFALVPASAEIEIDQNDDQVELEITDESMANIVAELARHFDFTIEGNPENWTDEPLSFSESGDLETVLDRVLADTNHVYGYKSEIAGGPARIASVTLLNLGSSGPMFESQPVQGPEVDSHGGDVAELPAAKLPGNRGPNRQPATPSDRNLTEAADSNTAPAEEDDTAVASTRSSNLSQSLEQRARQATGQPNEASGGGNADIQSLTQKALQDVQNLADALRSAEGGN